MQSLRQPGLIARPWNCSRIWLIGRSSFAVQYNLWAICPFLMHARCFIELRGKFPRLNIYLVDSIRGSQQKR
jgi:hypothetical protein